MANLPHATGRPTGAQPHVRIRIKQCCECGATPSHAITRLVEVHPGRPESFESVQARQVCECGRMGPWSGLCSPRAGEEVFLFASIEAWNDEMSRHFRVFASQDAAVAHATAAAKAAYDAKTSAAQRSAPRDERTVDAVEVPREEGDSSWTGWLLLAGVALGLASCWHGG